MATVVVLGAGISGHTAALFLRRGLKKEHNVVVVTPNSLWNWIPSNVWVGVGLMTKDDVTFPLAPLYEKLGIEFHQAKAVSIHPEGGHDKSRPFVKVEYTEDSRVGEIAELDYDFLINATGPKLNFAATAGLGPDGFTNSVCTYGHAEEAARNVFSSIEKMKKGERQTFVVGTGHGMCTCQGAAFEYAFNLEFELRRAGVRDLADFVFITNEAVLGDFGVGGLHFQRNGYVIHSRTFAESLYAERGLSWITGAHVQKIERGKIFYENLEGEDHELNFDFSMLIPPFAGVGLKAVGRAGNDITEKIFAGNGFLKVDADYTPKEYDNWKASDWPLTYQNRDYANIYAVGIAFAPPHAISRPRKSKRGTPISPTPPRTGMPSAIIGRAVATSICDIINKGSPGPTRTASMAKMGAACVASAGSGWLKGTAASMTMYPIVPDFETYPEYGRDLDYTFGEIGSSGHWIKNILHHMFLYKAKAKPFWWLIPE
ncbi:MAG: FAD/NAD(P)-binding oxidoreductase [bacterium]|nr:FAD/NAD(P)-binding oxidoreductase [bacterium]